jgi:alpha,alpha-trehalase
MNRRELLVAAAAAAVSKQVLPVSEPSNAGHPSAPGLSKEQWAALDVTIGKEWLLYISLATEEAIRKDDSGQLLFLPFPYVSPTAPGSVYRFMFGWDTDFVSRALITQGKADQARNHLLNYFFMIDRLGYMPNANVKSLITRSQTPLVADTTWRYYRATGDRELLYEAYPRLKRNYREYWCASHHQTPLGLATNRDSGDKDHSPRLAAEAETGLDWTPIFGGDVRRCVPLITNCALVRYAKCLAQISRALGNDADSKLFVHDSARRAALIRRYCWSEQEGFFFEYDFVSRHQLPCLSDCALWTLWAGVATPTQAKRVVQNLSRLEQTYGLSSTDHAYPTPSPQADYGSEAPMAPDGVEIAQGQNTKMIGEAGPLQWMYPAGWAPSHVIAVEGLDAYGNDAYATRIASKFLALMMQNWARTGHLWEKYNVVDGGIELPNARYGNLWMQGWTAAAVALLGRRVFRRQPLSAI